MKQDFYDRLKKEFGLKEIDEIENAFNMDCNCTEEDRCLEHLRNDVVEKIFDLNEKIIEPIVSGMDSLSTNIEQNILSEKERQDFFQMYQKIQVLKWENILLMVEKDENKNVEFIKKTWDIWKKEIKPTISEISRKMSKNWSELKFKKEKMDYSN